MYGTVSAGAGRLDDGLGLREEGDLPLRTATSQDDILVALRRRSPSSEIHRNA